MSRLPETGPSLRRIIEQQKRRATRNENASPYTRSGMSVTAEGRVEATGQMHSWDYDGTSRTDLGTAATIATSGSLSVQRAFVVTPGTYTVTGKMRAWASGSATASVHFVQPYLTVQVTG